MRRRTFIAGKIGKWLDRVHTHSAEEFHQLTREKTLVFQEFFSRSPRSDPALHHFLRQ